MTVKFDIKEAIKANMYDITPEQVVMLLIYENMKRANFKCFSDYLTHFVENDKIQRSDVSIADICSVLHLDRYDVENMAVKWSNKFGGTLYQHANINTYYFKGILNIIN